MVCQICGSKNIKIVGNPDTSHISSKFIRHPYKVVQCDNCEFYFVDPLIDLSQSEWSELYGNEYFGKMTEWHEKERLTSINTRLDRLAKSSTHQLRNFLDVGCGEGYALLNAYERGWNCFGFDISDNRLEEVKNKNIDFREGNIFQANYPDNFFDALYMDSVLEHVLNPMEYLKELNRIMSPGGTIYIGVPNEDSFFNDVRNFTNILQNKNYSVKLRPFEQPYHVVGYTEKTLKRIAKEASFSIVELVNFAAKFEFLKYHRGTKAYYTHLMLLPVDLLAWLMKREIYFEIILRK